MTSQETSRALSRALHSVSRAVRTACASSAAMDNARLPRQRHVVSIEQPTTSPDWRSRIPPRRTAMAKNEVPVDAVDILAGHRLEGRPFVDAVGYQVSLQQDAVHSRACKRSRIQLM